MKRSTIVKLASILGVLGIIFVFAGLYNIDSPQEKPMNRFGLGGTGRISADEDLLSSVFSLTTGATLTILSIVAFIYALRKKESAEPGATDNDLHCHGSCSEQHAPRQRRSRLT